MIYLNSKSFKGLRREIESKIIASESVENDRWQGVDVSKDPSARMHELRNVCFEIDLDGDDDLNRWRAEIGPNLPWADDHFLERVGGEPLNPGVQWANWPWATSADRHRVVGDKFNHTYSERLWPRWADKTTGGRFDVNDPRPSSNDYSSISEHRGIRNRYGDLDDLVELLVKDPFTRQAWIPLFFPEDTGVGDGGRKPCTLGYQFLRRGDELHVWYPLRSCDLVRHFADDVYLAVRLAIWVIEQCQKRSERWREVKPASLAMHLTSLHCFVNDIFKLRKDHGQ